MASQERITRELSVGEVVSETLELYRREFVKYFVLFLVAYAVYGAALTAIKNVAAAPPLPPHTTGQQFVDWFRTNAGTFVASGVLRLLLLLVFVPMIYGSAVRMASAQIQTGEVDLRASVRFGASKLIWVWILGLVVGVIVFVGFVALIVPGIILAMMFFLVLPVLMVENTGIVKTMNRSRELVSHRWLKTFATLLVFGIMIAISGYIAGAIGSLFGAGSTEVTNVLSALYLPIIPIALTVYYYSNLTRIAPAGAGQAPTLSSQVAPSGMKFCTNCGAQLEVMAVFCSRCGAKQPG